jgi:hypothetical protein
VLLTGTAAGANLTALAPTTVYELVIWNGSSLHYKSARNSNGER